MPNLVGIGNSQVPTNAMLGGLAYQDSVGEINLEKIKARTSDNAVDIFVYDTRNDSDGGAWRKRTQHTSWYNEGVSQYRGARKEFPAVAVIVVTDNSNSTSATTVIYDGDDPNLPMWMKWERDTTQDPFFDYSPPGSNHLGNYEPTSVSALNGIICVGTYRSAGALSNLNAGLREFHFIEDACYASNDDKRVKFSTSIADRDVVTHTGYFQVNPNKPILSSNVNDVAMTVLSNAPIDASTGLPVPTIAVGTDAGVSIIKDNGDVSDITNTNSGYNYVTQVKIDQKYVYIGFGASNLYIAGVGYAVPIPSRDVSLGAITGATTAADFRWSNNSTSGSGSYSDYYVNPSDKNDDDVNGTVLTKRGMSFGTESGLSILLNEERDTNGSIAHITKDYNTGYMHRDIKGAFLSSTDTTNIAGGNKVSNGSDWSGASGSQSSTPPTGWTGGNGATFAVETGLGASGNYIRLYNENNGGDGPNSYMYQAITTVVGKRYKYSAKQIHRATITVYMRIGTSAGGNELAGSQFVSSSSSTPKQVFGEFTATGTTTYVSLGIISGTHNYSVGWDDIHVSEMDKDRSVNSNSLHAVGTITRSPVATGAELVAYSNFSSGRYLFQPYNSDLNFTTTMSIMFWVKDWVGSDSLLHRGPGTTRNSKTSFHLYCSYDYNYRITFTTDGSTEKSFEFNHTANLPGWQCVCFTLSGGTVRGFRNGVEQTLNQTSLSGNIFSQATDQNGLWIGTGPVGGAADTASLALLRLSSSVPSAEQIKKIYNDEKHMFVENAKCTLHGTSDDVEALAYDDTNDILHVGTSSGRTEFQGLNRINNTTTAVTTAISASNELVAEQ